MQSIFDRMKRKDNGDDDPNKKPFLKLKSEHEQSNEMDQLKNAIKEMNEADAAKRELRPQPTREVNPQPTDRENTLTNQIREEIQSTSHNTNMVITESSNSGETYIFDRSGFERGLAAGRESSNRLRAILARNLVEGNSPALAIMDAANEIAMDADIDGSKLKQDLKIADVEVDERKDDYDEKSKEAQKAKEYAEGFRFFNLDFLGKLKFILGCIFGAIGLAGLGYVLYCLITGRSIFGTPQPVQPILLQSTRTVFSRMTNRLHFWRTYFENREVVSETNTYLNPTTGLVYTTTETPAVIPEVTPTANTTTNLPEPQSSPDASTPTSIYDKTTNSMKDFKG